MSAIVNNLPAVPLPSLSEREALFAEHFAVFDDPAAAWQASGVVTTTKRLSMQRAAYGYLARPHVRARVAHLRNRMAEAGPQASRAVLVRELEEAAGVDVREIVTLAVHHCPSCYSSPAYGAWWPNATLAAATKGDALPPDPMTAGEFDPDREPWRACSACAGAGRQVVHWTPFDQLSPPARRLLRGLELHSDGGLKRVLLADQNQLREQLHKTVPGFYAPATSVNLNLNAHVAPLGDMTRDEALAFLDRIAPQPDPSVVSEQ